METNVHYTIVGAFVLILITFITLAIIWLSSGFSFEHYTTYIAYMQESVAGLNVDSPVEFNGVDVGKVTSVEINHHNPRLVQVLLNIKSSTPITQGTVATLNTRGVTGFTYLALKDQSNDLRPLTREHGQPYPVIKTSPSLFKRLDSVLNQLSNNLQEITKSIQTVLDQGNLKSIKATLYNLEQVSGTLQAQTLPLTYQVLTNLNDITRSMSVITKDIKNNPSVLIRGVDHTTLGPGEKQ